MRHACTLFDLAFRILSHSGNLLAQLVDDVRCSSMLCPANNRTPWLLWMEKGGFATDEQKQIGFVGWLNELQKNDGGDAASPAAV